jgi:hypothetical protein
LRRQYPNTSLVSAAETEAYGSFMSKLHTIATKYNRTIVHWEGKTQDARRETRDARCVLYCSFQALLAFFPLNLCRCLRLGRAESDLRRNYPHAEQPDHRPGLSWGLRQGAEAMQKPDTRQVCLWFQRRGNDQGGGRSRLSGHLGPALVVVPFVLLGSMWALREWCGVRAMGAHLRARAVRLPCGVRPWLQHQRSGCQHHRS